MESCPVCMLRKGLAGGIASGESSFEEAVKPAPDQPPKRFEHYELVTGEDGKPVELGRGAMGVTYKAFECWKPWKRRGSWQIGDIYNRMIPVLEAQGQATLAIKKGRYELYAFKGDDEP